MSYDWDSGTLTAPIESPVCFGGIHFTFKFLFEPGSPVFGEGAYQSINAEALIDNVHNRVIYRKLLRKAGDSIAEFFPFIIVTEVSIATAEAEPWKPELGNRGRFPFSPARTALYRTNVWGPGFMTLYLLDAYKYKGTENDFPLAFGKNSVNPTFFVDTATVAGGNTAPIQLRVGDRRDVPLTMNVTGPGGFGRVFESPFALNFDSSQPYEANRQVDWNDVLLSGVRRNLTDRWGDAGYGPLPFVILLEHAPQGGADSPVRFYSIEDGVPGTGLQRVFGPGNLNDTSRLLIRGRREGRGKVFVTATNFAYPDRFASGAILATTVDVDVAPLGLTLTVGTDPDGESNAAGAVVLEDFWDGEALRGSFTFSVRAPMPNGSSLVPVPGQWTLYDSTKDALLIGTVQPKTIRMRQIFVNEEANVWEKGWKMQRPFGIELTIGDTSKVKFELPPAATVSGAGEFIYFGRLDHILRAVGPGDTDVTIEVVDLEEPVPDEFVIYRTPEPKTLQIHIPQPLVAQPTSWMDEWFSGAAGRDAAIDLTSAPPANPELIYNSGIYRGQALNHNQYSDSETIELLIDRPGQSRQTIDLLAYGAVNADGTLEFDVEELRRAGNDGYNTITLRAGKPINYVVNGQPDQEARTLEGVLPVVNTPAVFGTSSPILRRSIGSTSFRYSRSISAVLSDEVNSSDTGAVTIADVSSIHGIAYDPDTVNIADVTLPKIPGQHHVGVIARNEFGETIDSGEYFIAPSPSITSNPDDWSIELGYAGGFFSGGTPSGGAVSFKVGNSARSVDATVIVQNAITVTRTDSGTERTIADDDANTPAGYDPLTQRTFDVRVPRTDDMVEDSWNEVRVTGENEFSEKSLRVRVHRRGDHYYWVGARVTLNLVENAYTMDVSVRMPDGSETDFNDAGPFKEIPFPDGRSSDSLRYERIRWDIFEWVEDEDDNIVKRSRSSAIDLEDVGIAEGPDYEEIVPLYKLREDEVISGSPTTDWLLYDPADEDAHFYNPARVQDWVTFVPVFGYSQRNVDFPFEIV